MNSIAVLEEEERLQWKYLLDHLIELICCKLFVTKRVGVVVCSGRGVQNLEEIRIPNRGEVKHQEMKRIFELISESTM